MSGGVRHRHVVVGHDGRPAAQTALAVAAELAADIGAELHVVHSVTLADYGIDPDGDAFEAERDRHLVGERAAIDTALASVAVPWSYHEASGDPADRIAALADELDASYVVVGATHRGLLHVNGSVSKRLLHIQHRPVVVVPDQRAVSR